MANPNNVNIVQIWDTETIALSGTDTTQSFNLAQYHLNGFFSVMVVMTGSGTLKLEYELSHDRTTFVTPTSASDIVSAHTTGNDMYSFDPMVSGWIRIKATETGGANPIVLSAWLAMG